MKYAPFLRAILSDVAPERPKLKTLHPVSSINFAENVWLLPKKECPHKDMLGLVIRRNTPYPPTQARAEKPIPTFKNDLLFMLILSLAGLFDRLIVSEAS